MMGRVVMASLALAACAAVPSFTAPAIDQTPFGGGSTEWVTLDQCEAANQKLLDETRATMDRYEKARKADGRLTLIVGGAGIGCSIGCMIIGVKWARSHPPRR